MKSVTWSLVFAGMTTAHSGVWSIVVDENKYPGRDARIDDELGARRIEWFRGEKMKGNPWNPAGDVESAAITCKKENRICDSFGKRLKRGN